MLGQTEAKPEAEFDISFAVTTTTTNLSLVGAQCPSGVWRVLSIPSYPAVPQKAAPSNWESCRERHWRTMLKN